jgi:cysteinyl-tRNA synthetase
MGFDPIVFRYLVLTSHYRKGLTFSLDSMKAAQVALDKLKNYVLNFHKNGGVVTEVDEEYKKQFIEKISDDLSMPEAVAVVWRMMKSDLSEDKKIGTLLDFDKVLGLNLSNLMNFIDEEVPQDVLVLIEERKKAREEKNWAESDRLREIIKGKGYLVEDSQNSCKIQRIK